MKQVRLRSFDIAKGIGMLCIIAGHQGFAPVGTVVFSFHVPLFFLISGFFFRPSKAIAETAIKRCKRLLVPYIYCVVACCLGRGVVHAIQGDAAGSWNAISSEFVAALFGSGSFSSPLLGIQPIGAIWFLLALFWALSAYDCIAGKRLSTVIVLGVFAIGFITSSWWLPFSLQSAMCAVLFIHVGYEAKKRNWLGERGVVPTRIAIPAFIACLLVCVVNIRTVDAMSLVRCHFPHLPLDLIGALGGTLVVLWISNQLERVPVLSRGLEVFGRDSLIVMCLHLLELNVIPWGSILGRIGIDTSLMGPWSQFAVTFSFKLLWAIGGLGCVCLLRRLPKAAAEVSVKKRARSLDIAIGVAMLLVILGHQIGVDTVFRKLVFSFHVPFFFIASAILIKRSYAIWPTLKKSASSLIAPYIVACLLSAVLIALIVPEGTKSAVSDQIVGMMGGMSLTTTVFSGLPSVSYVWLVACLFVALNIYVLVRKGTSFAAPPVQYALVLALTFAGWLLGAKGYFLPWSVDVALFAQVFLLIGDEMGKRRVLVKDISISALLVVAVSWVALALDGYQVELTTRSYPGGILCVVTAILGSCVLFAVSHRIDNMKTLRGALPSILAWIGRNGMIILIVHCLVNLWSSTCGARLFLGEIGWLGNGLIEVLFCVAVCFLYGRIRLWCKDVFGAILI